MWEGACEESAPYPVSCFHCFAKISSPSFHNHIGITFINFLLPRLIERLAECMTEAVPQQMRQRESVAGRALFDQAQCWIFDISTDWRGWRQRESHKHLQKKGRRCCARPPIWITRLPSGLEQLVYLPLTAAPQIFRSINSCVQAQQGATTTHTHTHRPSLSLFIQINICRKRLRGPPACWWLMGSVLIF